MRGLAVFVVCLALLASASPALAEPRPEGRPVAAVQTEPFLLYRYTLSNGLAVWVQPRDDSQSVAALLVVRAGSRYEDASSNGIAHFVEHMAFTGTKSWSEEQLKQVIPRLGGRFNGWTGKERTTYFAHVAAGDLDLALAWLSEVVFRATFPPDKIDKERQVVFQERWGHYGWLLNALDSLGFGYELERAVQQSLFPDSSLGVRTVGEDTSLDNLSREALVEFYERHYVPANSTLILVGNLAPEHALDLALRRFGDLPAGERPPAPATPPLPAGGPQRIIVRGPEATDQVRFIAGARTVGRLDPDRWALEVLGVLLDGALTQEIRYRRGLVYDLTATNELFDDTGYFAITTKARAGNEDLIRQEAEASLQKLGQEGIGAGTLAAAKTALKGRWALSMEENVTRAKWLADWSSALPPGEPVPDYRAGIDAVRSEDVARVARTYFTPERSYVGLHLPVVTLTGGVEAGLVLLALTATAWTWRRIRARAARSKQPAASQLATGCLPLATSRCPSSRSRSGSRQR